MPLHSSIDLEQPDRLIRVGRVLLSSAIMQSPQNSSIYEPLLQHSHGRTRGSAYNICISISAFLQSPYYNMHHFMLDMISLNAQYDGVFHKEELQAYLKAINNPAVMICFALNNTTDFIRDFILHKLHHPVIKSLVMLRFGLNVGIEIDTEILSVFSKLPVQNQILVLNQGAGFPEETGYQVLAACYTKYACKQLWYGEINMSEWCERINKLPRKVRKSTVIYNNNEAQVKEFMLQSMMDNLSTELATIMIILLLKEGTEQDKEFKCTKLLEILQSVSSDRKTQEDFINKLHIIEQVKDNICTLLRQFRRKLRFKEWVTVAENIDLFDLPCSVITSEQYSREEPTVSDTTESNNDCDHIKFENENQNGDSISNSFESKAPSEITLFIPKYSETVEELMIRNNKLYREAAKSRKDAQTEIENGPDKVSVIIISAPIPDDLKEYVYNATIKGQLIDPETQALEFLGITSFAALPHAISA